MEGYCVKCKDKKEMNNMSETTTSNGRRMAQGVCPSCGTKMTKFLKG